MKHFPFQRTLTYFAKRLTYQSRGWSFSEHRKRLYLCEDWAKYYLPLEVKGLTILDVGAGEGETARFFLEHGAKKVICIECDDACFARLEKNAVGRPIECYHKMFSLNDLAREYDFIKMDIEGGEKELLLLPDKINERIALEVHGQDLALEFANRGYRLQMIEGNDIEKNGWLCYAY